MKALRYRDHPPHSENSVCLHRRSHLGQEDLDPCVITEGDLDRLDVVAGLAGSR